MNGPISVLFNYLSGNDSITLWDVFMRFFAILAVLLVLLPIHECAHALTAKFLGDDTAQREGRLTLNPFSHIDPVGALCMFFITLGWAKPVPINPVKCRKVSMRAAVSLTAAAGPISNILLSLVCVIISKLIFWLGSDTTMVYISFYAFYLIAQISIYLAVFNLIPVPPLDGSKIIFYFLKDRQVYFMEKNANIIRIALLALLFLTDILTGAISIAGSYVMTGLDIITGFIPSA